MKRARALRAMADAAVAAAPFGLGASASVYAAILWAVDG